MAPRTALATLAVAVAVSFALSLGLRGIAGSLAQEGDSATQTAFADEWDYQPTDLADLVANSPAIVVAEVDTVQRGEPLIIGPSDPETGVPPSVPTQRIEVHVTQAIDGQTPAGFTLFKLGGPGAQPEGSPPYDVGERYLLFLRPRRNDADTAPNPDGTWLVVAPDGRLEMLPSGELDATIDGPIAAELEGASVPEAVQAINEVQSATNVETAASTPTSGASG
jgi:hypothetical protein